MVRFLLPPQLYRAGVACPSCGPAPVTPGEWGHGCPLKWQLSLVQRIEAWTKCLCPPVILSLKCLYPQVFSILDSPSACLSSHPFLSLTLLFLQQNQPGEDVERQPVQVWTQSNACYRDTKPRPLLFGLGKISISRPTCKHRHWTVKWTKNNFDIPDDFHASENNLWVRKCKHC